jgi:hypothetical protein
MAFNKDEFLAAFLGQVSTGIAANREEAKAYKEKQEEAFERNIQLINTRSVRAGAAVSLGKEALQYLPEGANSKAMVRTAMASGMTGVQELRNKLAQAHADAGLAAGQKLSLNDVEAIISMPNIPSIDTRFIDMPLEQFAKETFGAYGEAAPAEDNTGVVGRLFGFGAKTRAQEQLREMPGMGEMSIADVNAAARLNEFNSLIPNAVMSFSEMERFTRNDGFTFANDMTELLQEAMDSKEADDSVIVAVRAEIDKQKALGITVPEADLDVVRREARRAYGERLVDQLIRSKAAQYGGIAGFFEHEFAMNQIAELMGEDYLEELKKAYNIQDGDPAKKPAAKPKVPKPQELSSDLIPAEADELASMTGQDLLPPALAADPATVPSLPEDKKRPGDPDALFTKPDQRKWDEKYGDRYNPDGSPIIVEPRPDSSETVMVEEQVRRRGSKMVEKNAAAVWDAKYASTHNPDGSPKQFEDD